MAMEAQFALVASMDVEPQAESTFNEVYDTEHVPFLSSVPGVLSIVRLERQELKMSIGGRVIEVPTRDVPKYTAIYELTSPEVLVSVEWADAIERGRWADKVRPYTRNRRHILLERMGAPRR
jgi:hypothetical protein